MKVAIITTLIDAEKVIDSFIDYHLAIGFDHLYLFFDNPNDPTIQHIRNRKQVTVIPCDAALRKRWLSTNAYAAYGHLSAFIDAEPMARQMLNMDVACQVAKQDGTDWLLHIDIDELFYSPHESVKDHFERMKTENKIYQRYLNYEAVPEKEDVIDYFKEVTFFKKNPLGYSPGEEANHKQYVHRDLFNYYKIGKMAAQVDKVFVSGIHEFVFDKNAIGKPLDIPPSLPNDPTILHYPCCGFEFFWRKYTTLGNFNPKAFGRQLYAAYEQTQRVIKQNNKDLAKQFYRKHVMLSEKEKEQLLTLGLAERITQPADLLSSPHVKKH